MTQMIRGARWRRIAGAFTITACCALAACSPKPSNGGMTARALSGHVTYLQRVALPAGAVITVSLDDVSLADTASTRLATTVITTKGENVPIPFKINYDPTTIHPDRSYTVSARITVDGKLSWTSTTHLSVLTPGNPADDVTVTVEPVS